MIYSKLYQLDTSDTEWQVAHLFEHLVIRGFYSALTQKRIQPNLVSWVNGESFEDTLFITTLFYTEELADEFEAYIINLPIFSESDIAYSLATLEAEDKVLISINDMAKLKQELSRLSGKRWNVPTAIAAEKLTPDLSIITEKRSAKDFRDIVILTKIKDLSLEEQKVLLRIHILLSDLVDESLLPINGVYRRNDSKISRRGNDMAYMTSYTIPKKVSLKDIKYTLATANLPAHPDDLRTILATHFKIFSSEPLWQDMPIGFFKSTGILTTNQEISTMATPERIHSIFQKTSFEVHRLTSEIKQYLDE